MDYNTCHLKKSEKIAVLMLSVMMGTAVFYIFYRSVPLGALLAVLVSPLAVKNYSKNRLYKRKLRLRGQFKDLLESLSVSMRAGSNVLSALEDARKDLMMLYGEDSDILRELNGIIEGYHNGIMLRDLFTNLGNRTQIEDIQDFARVFQVLEGKSNKTSEIIKNTQQIISEKMEVEMEIETMITASKMEQKLMIVIPIIIVAIMSFMGEGFMDGLHATIQGKLIATGVICLFIVAYLWGTHMCNIDV